jgi:hypothetical protein
MTKSMQIIGLLAIIPLFTMGLATNFVIQDVEAYEDPYAGKSKDADVTCRDGQVLVYHLRHNQHIVHLHTVPLFGLNTELQK